jgi:hypothetical protein
MRQLSGFHGCSASALHTKATRYRGTGEKVGSGAFRAATPARSNPEQEPAPVHVVRLAPGTDAMHPHPLRFDVSLCSLTHSDVAAPDGPIAPWAGR